MAWHLLTILAAASLVSTGVVAASETRSATALPGTTYALGGGQGGGAEKCRVDVVRTGPSGTANVTRQTLGSGACLCTVTTGPAGSANGAAEAIVSALLRDRECEGAPAPGDIGRAAGGGGGSGVLIGVLVAAGVAGGLAGGLGGDSNG